MPAITVNASGFVLDGPLVAGEPVAVSVSGVEFAESPRPCVTIRARFPNALLASADLTFDENAGAWTGTLYTATKQTVLAFLTARADEARPVALELIDAEHSQSVARVSVPMLNSSLLPTDNPPDAHGPEYLGVPGEPGPAGRDGTAHGKQYAFTVADGDRVEIPADVTSVVVSTEAEGTISIRLVPPELADGDDFSFSFIAGEIPSSATIDAKIGNSDINATAGHVFLVFRDGEDFIARDLGS